MSTREQPTSIYVIGPQEGPWKVGYSGDPAARLSNIQTGQAATMILHYVEETEASKAKVIERMIHRQLAPHRIRGEWFGGTLEQIIAEVKYAFIRWDGEPNLAFRFKRKLV